MTKVDHLPVNLLRDGRQSVWEDWIVFFLVRKGKELMMKGRQKVKILRFLDL